jgi:hypothetical protein
VRHAIGRAAGIGGIDAARNPALGQIYTGCGQRGNEFLPAGAIPARRIGLLALDAQQGVGCDRTGSDGTGINRWNVQQVCPVQCLRRIVPRREHPGRPAEDTIHGDTVSGYRRKRNNKRLIGQMPDEALVKSAESVPGQQLA